MVPRWLSRTRGQSHQELVKVTRVSGDLRFLQVLKAIPRSELALDVTATMCVWELKRRRHDDAEVSHFIYSPKDIYSKIIVEEVTVG